MAHIVVVEDEHTAALEIQMSLEEAGHSVPKVFSSGEGLISAFERGDWIQDPQLLLVDLSPAGMLNGVETVSHLQRLTNVPVIFLGSEHDQLLRTAAERLQPQGYIEKPIDREILCDTVQEVLTQQHDAPWQRALLSTLGDGIIMTDTHGRITYLNQVAERLLGVRNSAVRGNHLRDVYKLRSYATSQAVELPSQQVLEQGQTIATSAHLLVDVNGYELRINQRIAPLHNAANAVIGMHVAFHVMDREQSPSDRMQGKIEDFENTLAIIQSFTSMSDNGVIDFESEGRHYSFYLQAGRVVHFDYEEHSRNAALHRLARLEQGSFSFRPEVVSPQQSMNALPMHLLLEVLHQQNVLQTGNQLVRQAGDKTLFLVANTEQTLLYIAQSPNESLQAWLEPINQPAHVKDNHNQHMLVIEDAYRRWLVPNGDIQRLPQQVRRVAQPPAGV